MNRPRRILVIDIGGTHVKALLTGHRAPRKLDSGPELTPAGMMHGLRPLLADWAWDAVTIGYPGPVVQGRPLREPFNLGRGWVRFHFAAAFEAPVRLLNDAAMQALGSYRGGRMLFLGLGTGLGSAMVADNTVQPMELAHLPYRKGRTYEDYLGERGLRRLGAKKWRRHVLEVAQELQQSLLADTVVLGGGNARRLDRLPHGLVRGDNGNAFRGGRRLWDPKYASARLFPVLCP